MERERFEAEVSDLIQVIGLLVRRVRAAGGAHELSLTESSVIGRLARNGPATTADLARAEGVKPQSMGATVAALEATGIVERTPHPTDGRQVNIALTAKGAEVRKSRHDAKRAWLMEAISQLDERERETLLAARGIFRRMVEGDSQRGEGL